MNQGPHGPHLKSHSHLRTEATAPTSLLPGPWLTQQVHNQAGGCLALSFSRKLAKPSSSLAAV